MSSTEQRATLIGLGALTDNAADEFRLPWPFSLSGVTEKRTLTITLAWFSPINSSHQTYRVAKLWFNPLNNIARKRVNSDHDAVQRGTLQHEVLKGENAVVFNDGDEFVIKVNCRADAGPIENPIKYALAVTLEVAEGVNIPIYREILDKLAVPVPVTVGV